MSTIGSPIETSLLQAAQAQQTAAKAKDKERAASEPARRFQDLVDLKVAGIEDSEAIRKLPQNDSEEAEAEHREEARSQARDQDADEDEHGEPHIDVQA